MTWRTTTRDGTEIVSVGPRLDGEPGGDVRCRSGIPPFVWLLDYSVFPNGQFLEDRTTDYDLIPD